MIQTSIHTLSNKITRVWVVSQTAALMQQLKNPKAEVDYSEDFGVDTIVNDAIALDFQSGSEVIQMTAQEYGARLRKMYFDAIRQGEPELTPEEKIIWTAIGRFLWFVVQCEDEGEAIRAFDEILSRESQEIADVRGRIAQHPVEPARNQKEAGAAQVKPARKKAAKPK